MPYLVSMDKCYFTSTSIPFYPFLKEFGHAESNELCSILIFTSFLFIDFVLIELLYNFNQCHVSDYCIRGPTFPFLTNVQIDDLLAALSEIVPLGLLFYNELTILLIFLFDFLFYQLKVNLIIFCQNWPPKFLHDVLFLVDFGSHQNIWFDKVYGFFLFRKVFLLEIKLLDCFFTQWKSWVLYWIYKRFHESLPFESLGRHSWNNLYRHLFRIEVHKRESLLQLFFSKAFQVEMTRYCSCTTINHD